MHRLADALTEPNGRVLLPPVLFVSGAILLGWRLGVVCACTLV
jgi:hypothetical protein